MDSIVQTLLVVAVMLLVALFLKIHNIIDRVNNKVDHVNKKVDGVIAFVAPPSIDDADLEASICIIYSTDRKTPRGCGFFVSENGVVITAAHNLVTVDDAKARGGKPTLMKTGGTQHVLAASLVAPSDVFPLDVKELRVGNLDLAILGVRKRSPPPVAWSHLSLPEKELSAAQLRRSLVSMYYADIALCTSLKNAPSLGVNMARIVSANPQYLHISTTSHSGHSGAGIVIAERTAIGIHIERFSDLPERFSATSPSTDPIAQRLDIAFVREAIRAEILKLK